MATLLSLNLFGKFKGLSLSPDFVPALAGLQNRGSSIHIANRDNVTISRVAAEQCNNLIIVDNCSLFDFQNQVIIKL